MHTLIWLFCLISFFIDNHSQVEFDFSNNYGLHQIFSNLEILDAMDKSNLTSECSQYLQLMLTSLKNKEIWPLKFLDASSKLQSGILEGNFYDFGAFDECIGISENTTTGELYGKYCIIAPYFGNVTKETAREENDVSPPFALLMSSVCVPHTCTATDIKTLFQLMKLNVITNEDHCQSRSNPQVMNVTEITILCLLGIYLSITVMATLYGIWTYYQGKSTMNSLINCFSALQNGKALLNMSHNQQEISCINGIRVLSILWIACTHVFEQYHTLTKNAPEYIKEITVGKLTRFGMGASLCVDTFLLVSGINVSYSVLSDLRKGYKFNVPIFYLRRYLRLTPNILVVIILISCTLDYIGSGPIWQIITRDGVTACKTNWWTTLLYVQNFAHDEIRTMCASHTWFLALDMQCFILSPILIFPLLKRPKVCIMLAVLITMGIAVGDFAITWFNDIDPRVGQSGSMNYTLQYYILPHTRATAWIFGFILGHLIFTSMEKEKLILKRSTTVICWFLCLLTCICQFSFGYFDSGRERNVLLSCAETIFRRPTWAIAIGWLIFSCHFGYGGILNTFLSLPIFRVLARLSYSFYIFHITFVLFAKASARDPDYFTYLGAVNSFCAVLVLSCVVSVFVYLAVESPISNLQQKFLRKSTK